MAVKENIVIDNSVIIKLLIKEEGSEKAIKILKEARNVKTALIVPQLFVFEFFNIANRLVGADEANLVLDYLKQKQFSIVPLDEFGVMQANTIMASDKKISFYDATYHALAFQMNGTFLTADKDYYKKAKKFGRIQML